MHRHGSRTLLSASDLVAFHDCAHVAHSPCPLEPTATAIHALAKDKVAVRRIDELAAAHSQSKVHPAARRGDWGTVSRAFTRAEPIAANNPSVAASLDELGELAARKDK